MPQDPAQQTAMVFSRAAANVAKMYSTEQKYTGTDDPFDYKLEIFKDICARAGLPEEGYMLAFATMMKGTAESYYFSAKLREKIFEEACNSIRQFFEGQEYYNKNLIKWNSTSLSTVMRTEGHGKSIYNSFQVLVNELTTLQRGLAPNMRGEEWFVQKLQASCQGVPACQNAIANPSILTLPAIISSMKASINAWETVNTTSPAFHQHPTSLSAYNSADVVPYDQHQNQQQYDEYDESYYVDRQFRDNGLQRGRSMFRQGGRGQGYSRGGRWGDNRGGRGGSRGGFTQGRSQNSCWICKDPNCRAFKHPPEERAREKENFKRRLEARGKQFTEDKFSQYTVLCEGDEYDIEDEEYDEAFENIVYLVDCIEGGTTTEDKTSGEVFVTSFGEFSAEETRAASRMLTDSAFLHAQQPLMDKPTKSGPVGEAGRYISAVAAGIKSRYGDHVFLGILIDIGAARKSTAGYLQCQALMDSNREVTLDKSTAGRHTVKFGVGTATSLGTTTVKTPIGTVEFQVVDQNTPFLLCLQDMDRLGVYYKNTTDFLIIDAAGEHIPVVRRFGHAFLLINSNLKSFLLECQEHNAEEPCYLTETELRQLHRRFGHPAVERLEKGPNQSRS